MVGVPAIAGSPKLKAGCSVLNQHFLNEAQQRRLLANARHADDMLSDIEQILTASESRSAFPKYRPDVSLHQARLIRSHIARFRNHLTRVLAAIGVRHEGPQFGSLHSIRVTLTFVRIAVQEMAPEYLRGYGDLPEQAAVEIRGLCTELQGLLDALERNLALGEAADLQARLDRLQDGTRVAELLRLLDRIAGENELAEFRSPLLNITEKLESRQFEIAVFGRVSSGKSSLLNHVLHTDVLPVGVTPITAVPTRLVFGETAQLAVTFADRQVKRCPIGDLAQYASEETNPGNRLGVTRLVASLPSPRLKDGFVLVDTPGLGSLATAGAAETLAYLPQCDLGIVLVSSVNPINDEDLSTIHALAQAGIPALVALSKADLLSPGDRTRALAYTQQEVLSNLNLKVAVHPVSTVAGHEDMLENWFRGSLEPLYNRHRELAQESARRKAGALREAVAAALRSKLGDRTGSGPANEARLQEIERKLREDAGQLEEARRFCFSEAGRIRSLGPAAIDAAAATLVEGWNGDGPAATVEESIRETAAQAASQVSGRLRTVARELDSVLKLAGGELGEATADSSLAECLREMPRFEAALPRIEPKAPWFRSFRRLARFWVKHELRRTILPETEAGFIGYSRSLEAWARKALADMQKEFGSRADAYRAQLARLTTGTTISASERERIEAGLAELERFTTAESAAGPDQRKPEESTSMRSGRNIM